MKTSIARKIVMGLTGFFLITFILVHLLINSFSLVSPELFNRGSHFMATNPLIQIMQYVLAAGFLIHIIMGIVLTAQNKAARGKSYAKNNAAANSSISSRSMIITGLLVLVFLVLHMKDFFMEVKFGNLGHVPFESHGVTTMLQNDFSVIQAVFSMPVYTAIYVLAFIALGIHLNHGFQSAFQSLGCNHSKYNKLIKASGTAFSLLIAVGFSAIALTHFISSLS